MDEGPRSVGLTNADIDAACARLQGQVRRTPLLESPVLNAAIGGRLLVKAESLQHTGSFKFRGALNAVSLLARESTVRGVVAPSSGNHASAVAAAAQRFGIQATVVIPRDAPAKKIKTCELSGARPVFYDKRTNDRDELAAREAASSGAVIVRPSDDPAVIAGQATVGLELLEQADRLGAQIDTLLVPCGGGGLAAGCAWVFSQRSPATEILTVEPDGFDDMALSIEQRRRVAVAIGDFSICDGLLARSPSALSFATLMGRIERGLTVGDDGTAAAMVSAFEHLNLVLEPSGAIALAAALSDRSAWRGKTVAVVASGGNVDRDLFHALLAPDRDEISPAAQMRPPPPNAGPKRAAALF